MIDVGRLTQSRLPPRQPRPGHCHATSISGAPQGSRYDWTEILRHQLPSGDGTVALLGRSYYTSRTQRSRLTKFDNHGVGSSLTTTLKNRIRGIQHGCYGPRRVILWWCSQSLVNRDCSTRTADDTPTP
ncbi:hypothetical protein BV22DRAFT_932283 [Leucogyrophana mollusca]|uniref:Uncharacterized protein n=1 Tax=Leucogyrophana mollusca TaxID=85980 RepID=A0ACB8AWD3_9AGAM|nr:hypothetical protein BV22DRAFT_932283 [Leucogyrophana mollusca]